MGSEVGSLQIWGKAPAIPDSHALLASPVANHGRGCFHCHKRSLRLSRDLDQRSGSAREAQAEDSRLALGASEVARPCVAHRAVGQ